MAKVPKISTAVSTIKKTISKRKYTPIHIVIKDNPNSALSTDMGGVGSFVKLIFSPSDQAKIDALRKARDFKGAIELKGLLIRAGKYITKDYPL